jgi:hypothetical protein
LCPERRPKEQTWTDGVGHWPICHALFVVAQWPDAYSRREWPTVAIAGHSSTLNTKQTGHVYNVS